MKPFADVVVRKVLREVYSVFPLRVAYFNDNGKGRDGKLKCWNTLRRNQVDKDDKEDIY